MPAKKPLKAVVEEHQQQVEQLYTETSAQVKPFKPNFHILKKMYYSALTLLSLNLITRKVI